MYEPGDLLVVLQDFLESDFLDLLRDDPKAWQSLDVDYDPPRVERLWRQYGDFRVSLHCIHTCEKALYHPHPWPSAIHVVSGKYEMAVGTEETEAARIILTQGCSYEMLDPKGWHYVRPLKSISGPTSLSVMLTWKPFEPAVYDHGKFGKDAKLNPLTDEAKTRLLQKFRNVFLVSRGLK